MVNEFICKCEQCGEWFRKKDCLLVDEKYFDQNTLTWKQWTEWYCKDCQKSWEYAFHGRDNNLVPY